MHSCSFFFPLAATCSLWDLSSPTSDRTRTLSSESAESQPLDRQEILCTVIIIFFNIYLFGSAGSQLRHEGSFLVAAPGIFFFFLINLFILFYLFLFGCVGSSLLHAVFLQLQRVGTTLRGGARASYCSGFSCCGARARGTRAQQLWLAGSRVQAQQLWRMGLVALRMWDLPGPGLEPVSPALAGGFLTTVPPGKSLGSFLVAV